MLAANSAPMSFGSRREIHSGIGQTPKAVSVSEVRARLHDAARFRARSTSHTVAVRDGCTKIPLAAGMGSGGRNHSHFRHTGHGDYSVRPPGSARTDQVLEDLMSVCRQAQASFITAPSMTTPAVTYFQ